MSLSRRDALHTAITAAVRAVFNSDQTRSKLIESFPNLDITDEPIERRLDELSKTAVSRALQEIEQWSSQQDMQNKWKAVDQYFLVKNAVNGGATDNLTVPSDTLPEATSAEILMAQKQEEVNKLNLLLQQKEAKITQLKTDVKEHATKSKELRNKIALIYNDTIQTFETVKKMTT